MSPARRRRTPAERARQVILDDFEIGPKYVRLSAADRRTVDQMLEDGQYRAARRQIIRLDELRRLQRRESDRIKYGVGRLGDVTIDPSLMPLAGRVPLRDHEPRAVFSLFAFDYQCVVTVEEADGGTYETVTDNLGFDIHPIKQQIAQAAIRNIHSRIDGTIPGSPKTAHMNGKIARVALLVARRRA